MKTKCNETVLPAAHANKEERNGNEVTLVPHILSILSYPLCKSHAAHKECLNERDRERAIEREERRQKAFSSVTDIHTSPHANTSNKYID